MVRKAFDMILGISLSENKDVSCSFLNYNILLLVLILDSLKLCDFSIIFLIVFTFDFHQDYDKFWENYGKFLKLGCMEDQANHKRIAPLLRFFSSQSEEQLISLDEYVENMKPEQKDIYYIAADSLTSAQNAPFLERLVEKDFEVYFAMI